ncbi:hypothetical protein G6655_04000 [Polynucleobacter paneuropaeus]|nr:hypothetical protein [Polynucleobacter paneuropaeus]
MTINLYICVKNPFTERDFNRMGIAELSNHFNLKIFDCTPWLLPKAFKTRGDKVFHHPSSVEICSLRDLIKAIQSDGGYVLDFVGQFSPKAILMFTVFQVKKIRIVVMDSGAYPAPDIFFTPRSTAKKIFDALRHGGFILHLMARINRLLIKILPNQNPYIAFVSGDAWRIESRFNSADKKIPAHSFDYEVYRVQEAAGENFIDLDAMPYAVYLDEDITGHEDNLEMGVAAPATADVFYPALSRFFDKYQLISGQRIIIAGYPSEKSQLKTHFQNREIQYKQTAQLVKGASLVFAHASTAISFAVLWKKPIVFLTSKQIAKSWYQPWIEAPKLLLKSPLINIDENYPFDLGGLHAIDIASYNSYINCFIKALDSPNDSLWSIVQKTLLQEKL